MLQIVQPGLAGLMDGSVSTLAPIFAAAFATHKSHDAFLVGLAASVGAGISMAFAEALSDDGSLTGRGKPVLRGFVTGAMTAARKTPTPRRERWSSVASTSGPSISAKVLPMQIRGPPPKG